MVHPSVRHRAPSDGTSRVPLEFTKHSVNESEPLPVDRLRFPVFSNAVGSYVLLKHLAAVLNYPSSYQLIRKLLKRLPDKSWLKQTDVELNALLLERGLIDDADAIRALFYVSLDVLAEAIANREVLLIDAEPPIHPENPRLKTPKDPAPEDDGKVLLSQVFPQYESRHIPLLHSSFNSLSNLTKLNFYRNLPNAFHFLPNSKLSVFEREILFKENEYIDEESLIGTGADKDVTGDGHEGHSKSKQIRKLINRNKKHNINVDPNSLDLQDSIIPGQGYIQEFNVKHLCKVPNYFITSSTQPIASPSTTTLNAMRRFGGSSLSKPYMANETLKLSKNLQQLIYNNENDHRNTKYYYVKSYRGPGSGNYKDAALMNKINKIPLTTQPIYKVHKNAKEVSRYDHKRHLRSLKGLLCEKISQQNFENILVRQREFVEDFDNMEMLHNNLQFNVLVNSYREISSNTWDQYYKFKTTDYEQLSAAQRIEKKKLDYEQKVKEYQENERERQQKLAETRQKQMEAYHNPNANFSNTDSMDVDELGGIKPKELKKEKERAPRILKDEDSDDDDKSGESSSESDLEVKQIEKPLLERLADEIAELERPIIPPSPPSPDQIAKFVLPNEVKEVFENIPVDLRAPGVQIKRPIYSSATYADSQNPQFLNKIEMIRIPNPNSIGWDNFKKYSRQ